MARPSPSCSGYCRPSPRGGGMGSVSSRTNSVISSRSLTPGRSASSWIRGGPMPVTEHPRSICIGETIFLGPETERPKSHSGQKRSPQRLKRSRKSPPIAGFSAVSGKSSGSNDCVVDLVGFKLPTTRLWPPNLGTGRLSGSRASIRMTCAGRARRAEYLQQQLDGKRALVLVHFIVAQRAGSSDACDVECPHL
jgi:hypothetical protein